MGKITTGIKYGCGGGIGLFLASIIIPAFLLGGCLVLGVALEEAGTQTIAEVEQHARCELLEDATGCERLEDVHRVETFQEPSGETRQLSSGTRVKARGKGKEGCRRVDLADGSKWWLPGSAAVKAR